MSVTQLDDLMSLMLVKSASNSVVNGSQVSKTNCWPREPSPALARHTSAVDAPNWRETLNSFVTKYSTLRKTVRGCKVLPSSSSTTNNVRRRRTQPRQARSRANGNQHRKGDAAATTRLGEMELEIRSNGNVGPEYSPVVSLCDILKLNPNDKVKNKDNSTPPLDKDQFLNYFDLGSNTESSCTLVDKGAANKYHPKTLVKCPHVPFSSDLGIKLTKDWHVIPPETHVKKLERLERYIRPNLFNIRHATDCSYEIIYNKNTDYNHIYKFPTKTYRWKGKLSRKSRFLLKHYCKPCTVNLTRLENTHIRLNSIPSEIASNKMVMLNERNNQKENVQQKVHMEARVILTDKLKENVQLYKPPSGNTVARSRPSHTNAVPKSSCVTSSHLSMHQQSAGRLQNTVLKTLSPRNENSVGTTMDIKKPVELVTKCENLINASVILTPINFFELQTSVLESGKTSSDGVDTSTAPKHDSKKNKVNKIGKKRVNIYYPRRISPRLNIVASTSPVKVM